MLLVHEKKTDMGMEDLDQVTGNASPSLLPVEPQGFAFSSSSEGENRKNNALSMSLRLLRGSKGTEHMRMLCKGSTAVTIISIGKTSISASLSN